jgi:uncharacterized membrane protein YphA (DoxX/SURF4 family)
VTRAPAVLRELSVWALRLILGAVFIYAAFVKIRQPQVFADGIATYQILPDALVNVFALALPPFEMLLGAWLIAGWRRRSAAFCAAFTLFVFSGAMASARLRGLHVDCACFGAVNPSGAPASESLALARDGLLAAGALILYAAAWLETRRGSSG